MKTVSFTTRMLALLLCLAALLCVFASCKSNIRGEGTTGFTLTVTQKDGSSEEFEIRTDKDNVGDALLDAGMITGSTSEYGLFIESVNGLPPTLRRIRPTGRFTWTANIPWSASAVSRSAPA